MKDLSLFIGLSRTLLYVQRETEKIFRQHHLTTGQFAVMEALYHKGEKSVKELKELILITSGNMPVILKNLERQAYIEKKTDGQDHRIRKICLTEKGRKKIEEVFPKNQEKIEALFSVWTREEKEMMQKAMKQFGEEYSIWREK